MTEEHNWIYGLCEDFPKIMHKEGYPSIIRRDVARYCTETGIFQHQNLDRQYGQTGWDNYDEHLFFTENDVVENLDDLLPLGNIFPIIKQWCSEETWERVKDVNGAILIDCKYNHDEFIMKIIKSAHKIS